MQLPKGALMALQAVFSPELARAVQWFVLFELGGIAVIITAFILLAFISAKIFGNFHKNKSVV